MLLVVLTVSAFAATSGEQPHELGTMTPNSPSGHDMNSMTVDSQNGHDMNNMSHDGQGNKPLTTDDNPWPVLYGFGGAILAVIIVAGIMKFTSLKGQDVK